jgi:hypothetical protein
MHELPTVSCCDAEPCTDDLGSTAGGSLVVIGVAPLTQRMRVGCELHLDGWLVRTTMPHGGWPDRPIGFVRTGHSGLTWR